MSSPQPPAYTPASRRVLASIPANRSPLDAYSGPDSPSGIRDLDLLKAQKESDARYHSTATHMPSMSSPTQQHRPRSSFSLLLRKTPSPAVESNFCASPSFFDSPSHLPLPSPSSSEGKEDVLRRMGSSMSLRRRVSMSPSQDIWEEDVMASSEKENEKEDDARSSLSTFSAKSKTLIDRLTGSPGESPTSRALSPSLLSPRALSPLVSSPRPLSLALLSPKDYVAEDLQRKQKRLSRDSLSSSLSSIASSPAPLDVSGYDGTNDNPDPPADARPTLPLLGKSRYFKNLARLDQAGSSSSSGSMISTPNTLNNSLTSISTATASKPTPATPSGPSGGSGGMRGGASDAGIGGMPDLNEEQMMQIMSQMQARGINPGNMDFYKFMQAARGLGIGVPIGAKEQVRSTTKISVTPAEETISHEPTTTLMSASRNLSVMPVKEVYCQKPVLILTLKLPKKQVACVPDAVEPTNVSPAKLHKPVSKNVKKLEALDNIGIAAAHQATIFVPTETRQGRRRTSRLELYTTIALVSVLSATYAFVMDHIVEEVVAELCSKLARHAKFGAVIWLVWVVVEWMFGTKARRTTMIGL